MAESFLDTLTQSIEEWLWSTGITYPPYAGIFFIFVTIFISLLSNLLNHLLIDMETMSRENEVIAKHSKDKKEAMKNGDKKLWIKVKRQEPMIQEIQQKSMMKRLLPMLVTYGPIIYIFTTLRATFQAPINLAMNGDLDSCESSCGGVVVLPFDWSSFAWFSSYSVDPNLSIAGYGFWYFLSAIVTSSVFLKIFGINLSRNPQQKNQIM